MPDPTPTPGQQDPTPNPGQTPGQQVDWEARYKGLSRILSEKDAQIGKLTETIANLEAEKGNLAKQLEQLNEALKEKDGEVSSTRAALEKAQEDARDQLGKLNAERDSLLAEVTKFRVLKQFPDLIVMADEIPAMADEAKMKEFAAKFASGIEAILNQKREQWKAGLTYPANPPRQDYTRDEIMAQIEKTAGTPEAGKWIDMWMALNKE